MSPPAIPTFKATHQVLKTVELLEKILLELPVYDLFAVQRTDTTFHKTVTSSPRIQRAMFLEPDSSTTPWSEKPKINPILKSTLEKFLFQLPKEAGFLDVRYFTVLRTGEWAGRWMTTNFELHMNPHGDDGQRRRGRVLLPKLSDDVESWRRMLLIQPPPVEIEASLYKHPTKVERGGSSMVWFDGRSTLGTVFAWLEREASILSKMGEEIGR